MKVNFGAEWGSWHKMGVRGEVLIAPKYVINKYIDR